MKPTICQRCGCGVALPVVSGRGRPRKYCDACVGKRYRERINELVKRAYYRKKELGV